MFLHFAIGVKLVRIRHWASLNWRAIMNHTIRETNGGTRLDRAKILGKERTIEEEGQQYESASYESLLNLIAASSNYDDHIPFCSFSRVPALGRMY